MNAAASIDPALESLLAFWEESGLDVTAARATARQALRQTTTAPEPALAPPAAKPKAKRGPVDDAAARAAAAADLTALAAAIDSFDGCTLKPAARRSVFLDGPHDAPVLIVGDAPRREDDAEGRPFLGPHGRLLDRMLAAIGLDRSVNVALTNAVFWRPPGDRPPDAGEVAVCRPFLERAIVLMQPRIVVFVGPVSAPGLVQRSEAALKLRGKRFDYGQQGLTLKLNAMVMLDPAYLLKRPQEKGLAWADLLMLEAWLDELGIARAQPPGTDG